MESRTKLFGHPIHPMLIVIPLGLFIMSVVFDILYFASGNAAFSTVAYYDIAAGIIGGLLAALFGFIDWLSIPSGTRAKVIGGMHGVGNVIVVALFAVSWFVRNGAAEHRASTLAFAISIVAILLGSVTAWLGGELVYRLRMAVDDGANLDAPSSLSGQPANRGREAQRP